MNKTSQKFLWIFLAIVLILGALWQFYPLPSGKDRLNRLPLAGQNFSGKEIPLNEFEEQIFKEIDVKKRIYNINGQYFFVTALDGTNNRHTVHDPYYCFRGSGWTIESEKHFSLEKGRSNVIQISKNNETREAMYWFSNGESNYSSPMLYWWQTTLRRITLGKSGPEPLLIMIQPLTNSPVDWEKIKQDFKPLFKI